MEEPTHKFSQGDLLKGMTSTLKEGACWGLSVKWLLECMSAGPSVAGLAIKTGTTAHEALVTHARFADDFLSGADDDDSIGNITLMMSGMQLDVQRNNNVNTRGHLHNAVSIIAAMSGVRTFHGLIVFACPLGRHAMAVTNTRNVWSLFDPNFGTWTFAGDADGAPVRFSKLLSENFQYYAVTKVKFYTAIRLG